MLVALEANLSRLGRFELILADPPWDIHMNVSQDPQLECQTLISLAFVVLVFVPHHHRVRARLIAPLRTTH